MLVNELELVGLVLHELLRVGGVELEPLELLPRLDDRRHLLFDLGEVLGGEGLLDVEIVVEAVFDGGSDRVFRVGVEMHDRLRQHVGGGVPEGMLALRVVEGEDREGAVLRERGAQVDGLPVDPGRAGRLIEARAEALCHFRGGRAGFKLLDDAAFQRYVYHIPASFLSEVILRNKKSPHPPKDGMKALLHGSTRIARKTAPLDDR